MPKCLEYGRVCPHGFHWLLNLRVNKAFQSPTSPWIWHVKELQCAIYALVLVHGESAGVEACWARESPAVEAHPIKQIDPLMHLGVLKTWGPLPEDFFEHYKYTEGELQQMWDAEESQLGHLDVDFGFGCPWLRGAVQMQCAVQPSIQDEVSPVVHALPSGVWDEVPLVVQSQPSGVGNKRKAESSEPDDQK